VLLSYEDDGNDMGLSNFSDLGLQFLAEGCPRLERLCLIWCSAVTSCGLVMLAQACRGLKVLDMQV
jgi:F-box/leucine-rich repeat protein 2/20